MRDRLEVDDRDRRESPLRFVRLQSGTGTGAV
jgi:hypothetical protein